MGYGWAEGGGGALPVGATLFTPFLINQSWVHHTRLLSAGADRGRPLRELWAQGAGRAGLGRLRGFVPWSPRGKPGGWTDKSHISRNTPCLGAPPCRLFFFFFPSPVSSCHLPIPCLQRETTPKYLPASGLGSQGVVETSRPQLKEHGHRLAPGGPRRSESAWPFRLPGARTRRIHFCSKPPGSRDSVVTARGR